MIVVELSAFRSNCIFLEMIRKRKLNFNQNNYLIIKKNFVVIGFSSFQSTQEQLFAICKFSTLFHRQTMFDFVYEINTQHFLSYLPLPFMKIEIFFVVSSLSSFDWARTIFSMIYKLPTQLFGKDSRTQKMWIKFFFSSMERNLFKLQKTSRLL